LGNDDAMNEVQKAYIKWLLVYSKIIKDRKT
jgi:hypothetical protein